MVNTIKSLLTAALTNREILSLEIGSCGLEQRERERERGRRRRE
jgi:hypothetical protein